MTLDQANALLKQQYRSSKTGELHKVVLSVCQAKRLDHSILHDKYAMKLGTFLSPPL